MLLPRASALAATAASDDTALTVTTNEGYYFKAGDIVRNVTTGEAMRVTATGASALTVVRAIGGVAAASSASSATAGQLVIVGGSNAQGATLPTALITERVLSYNYTSITRNSFRFTETVVASDYYTGNQFELERMKKAIEHKRDIEDTLWFGARSYSASDPPRHTAGGVAEFLASATNATSATQLDKSTLADFLTSGLQYGSKNKVLFAAPKVAQVISELLSDNYVRSGPDFTRWGVKVDALISGVYGSEIPVVVKRDWGAWGTGTLRYGSNAFLIDMENVQYSVLRNTAYLPVRQARDADEKAAEFLTEHSLRFQLEQTHAKLYSVTT